MLGRVKKIGRSLAEHPEVGWYSLLAVAIMGPMLLKGYVLTLDMVFTPKLGAPTAVSNDYVFRWLLHGLNFVLTGQVIQKIVIFVILVLGAVGAHRLIATKDTWPKYFAGLFYTINPFTYERWMAGQYLIVFGYALLPFAARALFRFARQPRKRTALPLSLWYTAVALVSVHMFVLAVLLGVITWVVFLAAQSPKGTYYRDLVRYGIGAAVAVAVLNSYWLLAVAHGTSPISRTIDAIGSNDFAAFTTASNPHAGLVFNVLSMYGFWLEPSHRFGMPNTHLAIWFGGFGLLAVFILLGMRQQIRRHNLPAACLALAMALGFVMALGVDAPLTGGLTRSLIEHVPLLRGFREPEKFSALLVLGYVYFAAYGLERLVHGKRIAHWPEGRRETLFQLALLLPILYTATMPLGFANQLKPVSYPPSWYSFDQQLARQGHPGKVLFLPWHEYMSFDFAPRVIANPAPGFFTNAKIISGTNAEFKGVQGPAPDVASRYVDQQVLAHTTDTNAGQRLAKIHVEYVLLSGGYDYKQYAWLADQHDLKLVSSRPSLAIYRNEAYRD